MVLRRIIAIDEDKCNGCGLCIPACHEGALQIVDGKAKLLADQYCDGLGDCLGKCPHDAITIIEREADEYDDEAVQQRLANLKKEQDKDHFCSSGGCPGSKLLEIDCSGDSPLEQKDSPVRSPGNSRPVKSQSHLKYWPVQLSLVPTDAHYFKDASLLICADCVPFVYPNLHHDFMQGRVVLVGCPKLDEVEHYIKKLAQIFSSNNIADITLTRMEVPCCGGMKVIIEKALHMAGKDLPIHDVKIGIRGEII